MDRFSPVFLPCSAALLRFFYVDKMFQCSSGLGEASVQCPAAAPLASVALEHHSMEN